jgi:UDP-N-acetylmuramyl pentapeptide synthase
MIVIGVVENLRERNTFKLLKEIFFMWNYETIYENKTKSMAILNQNKNYIMIIDISPEKANAIGYIGIDFNIIIHTFLKSVDYDNQNIKDMFLKSKYIIINSDEDRWTSLLDNNVESIVITYGFNNKSTVNPSSYNIHDIIEANIGFQRVIYTILGEDIDPFELPIKINSRSKVDLYSGIAAMACGLILGIDLFLLDEVLEFKGIYMR